MAVGVGFEPTEGHPSTVFKTAAFDHSASPPKKAAREPLAGRAHYIVAPVSIKLLSSCRRLGAAGIVAGARNILRHHANRRCFRCVKQLRELSLHGGVGDRLGQNAWIIDCSPLCCQSTRIDFFDRCFHRIDRISACSGDDDFPRPCRDWGLCCARFFNLLRISGC